LTRGKISVGRAHFSRQFTGWAGPEEIDDVALAVMPLGASGRYNDLQYLTKTSAAVSSVSLEKVPDNFQRWIPWLSCFHQDPALTSHMWIAMRDLLGNSVTLVGSPDVTEFRQVSIRRPLVLPEGWVLRAHLATATAAGKNFGIHCFYVDTPIGEYVAPL